MQMLISTPRLCEHQVLMFLNKTELSTHEIAETIFLTAEKHLANSKIAETIFLKLSSAVHLWTNTTPAKFPPFTCIFPFNQWLTT